MSALVGRTGALLAVSSAVLHGATLGPSVTPWVAVLTVAMLVGCLYCAYELWTRDTLRSWVLVAAIVEILLAATVLLVRTRRLAPAVVAPCHSGHHDSGGTTGRQAGSDLDRLPEPD